MSGSIESLPPGPPLIDGVPACCQQCGRQLCLRQQVINLALGNVETVFCLSCLGQDSNQEPVELLASLKGYIQQRECFAKQWRLYTDVECCPDRKRCYPQECFSQT